MIIKNLTTGKTFETTVTLKKGTLSIYHNETLISNETTNPIELKLNDEFEILHMESVEKFENELGKSMAEEFNDDWDEEEDELYEAHSENGVYNLAYTTSEDEGHEYQLEYDLKHEILIWMIDGSIVAIEEKLPMSIAEGFYFELIFDHCFDDSEE